jgi:ABC-type molybdate transport system substrate-binding protein
MKRALPRVGLAAVLLLAAGCASDEPDAPPADAAPQVQPGATLRGFVGEPDAPEAFTIGLQTDDGEDVEVVAAGTYTLVVEDLAQIHNFHLTGPGVDVQTDVSGTGKETFEVTFSEGAYEYVCDPHPSMTGALRAV